MPNVGFGGTGGGSYTGSGTLSSTGISLPNGRKMANNSDAILITRLFGYIGGRGGSRANTRLKLGSAQTGLFTTPSQSADVGTGYRSTNAWLTTASSATFTITWSSGLMNFGRGGSGHTSDGGPGWSGTLGGAYTYVQAPTAPRSLTLSSDSSDSISASWLAPSDNGGTSITGYQIQYSTDPSFSGASTLNVGNVLNTQITGLTGGSTYYVRVAAKNAVTNAASTTSVFSAAASIAVASSGAVFDGIPAEFTENPGVLWTLTGHNVGFNAQGEIVNLEEALTTFTYYNRTTTSYEEINTVVRRNSAWATDFTNLEDEIYARNIVGENLLFVTAPNGEYWSTQTIAFKTRFEDGQPTVLSWQGQPLVNADQGTGQTVSVTLDPTSEELTVDALRWAGGFLTPEVFVADISSLDLTNELSVYLTFTQLMVPDEPYKYTILVGVRESDDYVTPAIEGGGTYEVDNLDVYTDPWEISGLARSLFTSNLLSGAPFDFQHEWENPKEYAIEGALDTYGPVTSYFGNVWEYLQMAASGTRCEIIVHNNTPTATNIASRDIDITNVVGSPRINVSCLMAPRFLQVEYSNAEPVNLSSIYDASLEGDATFSVEVFETRTEAVTTRSTPQTVLSPVPTGTYPNPAGTYVVTDSEGGIVPPQDWVDAGGRVTVAVDETTENVILVTLRGPSEAIIGAPAPYTIGARVETEARGTLKVIGSGLSVNPKVRNIPTGASPDRTPRETSGIVRNPFIQNLEQAYDRGTWAAARESIRIELSGVLPLSVVSEFGLTVGSLIRYKHNIFRISRASLSNIDVSFDADAYCRVSEVDAIWDGQEVWVEDAHWAGYEAQDSFILPLR